jgi:hypothetical protein
MTRGFVQEPNGRGTMGIVWSCAATVFLCTYSSLHLDVPTEYTTSWSRFWRMAGYIILGLLAPEAICIKAIDEFIMARKLVRHAHEGKITLSAAQAHLIRMDGVNICYGNSMAKQIVEVTYSNCVSALSTPEVLDKFPSNEEINARTKIDFLGKFVTVVQIIWFAIQVIVRHAQAESISLLEVSTLAYISMAVSAYAAWWEKPQGISAPITIYVSQSVDLSKVIHADFDLEAGFGTSYLIWNIATALFSGTHLLAWNYDFPSIPEKWLWRASSLSCFVFGSLSLQTGLALQWEESTKTRPTVVKCLNWSLRSGAIIYSLSRLSLLVQSFLVFRSAPSSIYDTVNWFLYTPGFG